MEAHCALSFVVIEPFFSVFFPNGHFEAVMTWLCLIVLILLCVTGTVAGLVALYARMCIILSNRLSLLVLLLLVVGGGCGGGGGGGVGQAWTSCLPNGKCCHSPRP